MRQVTLMKKLLFFDIDGTLVDFGNSTMSPSTADALINAKQNGHMIFLCTGRSYNQIYPSLKPLILTAWWLLPAAMSLWVIR